MVFSAAERMRPASMWWAIGALLCLDGGVFLSIAFSATTRTTLSPFDVALFAATAILMALALRGAFPRFYGWIIGLVGLSVAAIMAVSAYRNVEVAWHPMTPARLIQAANPELVKWRRHNGTDVSQVGKPRVFKRTVRDWWVRYPTLPGDPYGEYEFVIVDRYGNAHHAAGFDDWPPEPRDP